MNENELPGIRCMVTRRPSPPEAPGTSAVSMYGYLSYPHLHIDYQRLTYILIRTFTGADGECRPSVNPDMGYSVLLTCRRGSAREVP